MALKVGELYASFGIDSSGIGSAISGIEKKCSGIASSLTKTGAILSASVTAPIVAFGKEIYTAGTAFYGQMSRVEAISGATADEIKALTAKAIEMGSTTSFTASQAGQALEYMAMAGWDTEAMLAGLAPIMDLAAASGEDLGTVSDIVTDALTAFGLTAEDAAHFSDVLAATATSANTNVGMMGYTFQQVGALAGALGYKIDDMAVAIGIMANAGIKGEKAGTQLRAIISNLADPTTEMADAMRELGLSLTDSSGQVLPFNELLGNLRTSFAGLNEEERAMYAATIAGKEGMAGLLALINASDEDIAELTKAIQECEGATGKMASTILDNAAGDVTIFKSAVEGLQITLWGLVEDSFRDVVQGATKVVDSFRTMDSQTQTTILKVAGLAAAAGPAMIGLGGIIGAAGKLLPLMGALISPLGIVTAGVALFGVAAVDAGNDIGKGFVKLSKSMKKSLSDINKNLSNQIKTVSKRIPALASSISEGLGEIMPVAMESAMTIITGFVSTIADNASDLAGIGLTIVNNIVDGVAAGLPKLLPAGAQMVTNIATSLISNLPNLLSALGGLAMSIWDSLHAVNWSELGGQIWNAITSAFKQTGDWVKHAVLGEKYTPEAGWGEVGAAIWESIKSGIKATGDWVKKAVLGESYTTEAGWDVVGSAIWTSIKSGVKATGDWVKQLVLGETYTTEAGWDVVGSAIWTSIKSGIKATGDWLAALIMPEGTTFEAGTGWSTIGKSIWESIKSGISATGDWLAGLIMPANTTFTAGAGWKTIGSSVWTAIQGGISATGDWLAALIMPANTTFTAGTGWSTIGKAIWTAIQGGISATGDWVKSLILGTSYTADAGWSTVGSAIWASIKSGISATGDWVKSLVLGSAYTADAGWNIVGSAIWGKITSGITATGDWVKGLVLGAEYTADAGWSTVGKAIWTKIQTGITATGDWLASLIMPANSTFEAGEGWASIGKSIWAKIQTGITATGDWIKGLILGNAFTADSDWTDVGEKIVSMISSGLKSLDFTAETMAANLTSLGNFVQTFVKNMLENKVDLGTSITTFVTNLVSEISTFNGWAALATTFGTIATSIINGIVTAIPTVTEGATSFISAIGSMLSSPATKEFLTAATNVATNIIDSIVKGIPKVVDGAKSIVGAIGTLLSDIDWSGALDSVTAIGKSLLDAIIAAIGGIGDFGESVVGAVGTALSNINWEKVTVSLDGFVTMLSNGISEGIAKASDAVTNIVAAIGDWLGQINWEDFADSAKQIGTTIINGMVEGLQTITDGATEIATALSDFIKKIDWKEATDAAMDIAGSLLSGLIEGIGKIDFNDFLAAVGDGIAAAGQGLGEVAGSIVENLIAAIVNIDNWGKLVNLGAKLVEAIAAGIYHLGAGILSGAWSFVEETLKGLFRGLGFEFEEWSDETIAVLDETATVIDVYGDEVVMSLEDMLADLQLLEWSNMGMEPETLQYAIDSWKNIARNGTPEMVASIQNMAWLGCDEITNLFTTLYNTTATEIDRAAALIAIEDLGLDQFIVNSFRQANPAIEEAAWEMSSKGVDTFEEAFEQLGLTIPEAVKTGMENGMTFLEAAAAYAVETASTANKEAEAAASATDTGDAVVDNLAASIEGGSGDVKDATEGIVDENTVVLETWADAQEHLGVKGTAGIATGIENGKTAVTDTMAEVSNAAVEAFLKEMSYDTGYELGQEYTKGIQQGASSQKAAVTAVMATVASSIKNTVSAIMSNSVGHGIGYQFSSGIAAGIRAGIGLIQSAAAAAAAAAVGGSRSELDINSPSRVAKKEVGWMYDEGIAVGLLDRIPIIRKAASDVAASMHDDFMVGDPSHGTVYSSGKTVRQAAKETAAQSSEDKSLLERARTMGIAIAEELINSGALEGDVIVDGEKTGRKVSGAVSRKINRDSKKTVTGRTGKAVLA